MKLDCVLCGGTESDENVPEKFTSGEIYPEDFAHNECIIELNYRDKNSLCLYCKTKTENTARCTTCDKMENPEYREYTQINR